MTILYALPHSHNRLQCLLLVEFGIDLGDGGGAVAEDDAGGFQAKLFTQERGGVVAELVGVPMVLFFPRLQFFPLLFGQAVLPLCPALAGMLGQMFRGWESRLGGPDDSTQYTVSSIYSSMNHKYHFNLSVYLGMAREHCLCKSFF